MYSVKMKGIPPPSCPIHHMGTDHWITSVQDTEDEQVILFDSSQGFSPRLSRSLEMQLFAIYGRGYDAADKKTDQEDPCFIYLGGN